MKRIHLILSLTLLLLLSAGSGFSQGKGSLAENAALRYWSAFSVVQDFAITDRQAKELNAILAGTTPYDDSKYKVLLEKNTLPLEIMARGTSLANCDWGLDYGMGDNLPVEYSRKALVLGRLNVLYALHLFKNGDKDGGVRALEAGLKFSRDAGNGASLFGTLIAKDLLVSHLRAVTNAIKVEQLSAVQRARLRQAVGTLGPHGVDWESAMKLEMKLLNKPSWQASISLAGTTQAYLAAVRDSSQLPKLQQVIANLPLPLRDVIPDPAEVVQQKEELDDILTQTRSLLT